MADGKFVAYYRVSTQRQGQSGLGLEAQQRAVADYLNGGSWKLVAEFTEVESGRRKNRPQLAAALEAARQQKATLVIAKLDRLARNVAFVANLMDSKVEFVAVDFPQANRLTLHILAAVAEHEAKVTGERTKAALQAAKARGTVLGTNGKALARKYRSEALGRASGLADVVRGLQGTHRSVRALAVALNERGVPTPNGGQWHASSVHRLLRRIEETQSSSAA
jgi:DNA invertase Pin-like site-specific DNA recombinase